MEALSWGHGLAEAPRVDSEGNVYFSDVLKGGVHRLSPDGELVTVVPKRRGVGGLALHARGGLVVSGRDVLHVGESETRTLLSLEGVTGFNDLTTDAAGRVLVGSLRYRPLKGEPVVPGELWRISSEAEATQLCAGIDWPNGVGLSPDGRTAYVSDYAGAQVLALALEADGESSEPRHFAAMPHGSADGLAVDSEGGVWVALGQGGGIARFDSDGSLQDVMEVPAGFVSSLCFGGPDRRDLYITTADNDDHPERGGTLFKARAPVAGLVPAEATV